MATGLLIRGNHRLLRTPLKELTVKMRMTLRAARKNPRGKPLVQAKIFKSARLSTKLSEQMPLHQDHLRAERSPKVRRKLK